MGSLSSSIENHLFLRKEDDDDAEKNMRLQQIRSYNATTIDNRGASAALILASVAATAKAGQYTIQAYNEWKESQPPPPAEEETKEETTTKAAKEEPQQQQQKEQKKDGGKRENFFAKFFNMGVGKIGRASCRERVC